MNFLHTYNPEPIAFTVGSLDVHWYGILLAVAVVLGLVVTLAVCRKKKIDTRHVYNLFFLIAIFGIIGGRIGHVLGDLEYYGNNVFEILKMWHGGIAVHGVLLAGGIVVYAYCKKNKLSFWQVTDSIVFSVPLMQAIGRLGNYFNQEIFGKPTDVAWGIPITEFYRPAEFLQYEYFHPLFLYESILMLLVFALFLLCVRCVNQKAGTLTLLYFMIFPAIRFSLDFLRVDMLMIGPLLLTQWISIILFVSAFFLLYRRYHHKTVANTINSPTKII